MQLQYKKKPKKFSFKNKVKAFRTRGRCSQKMRREEGGWTVTVRQRVAAGSTAACFSSLFSSLLRKSELGPQKVMMCLKPEQYLLFSLERLFPYLFFVLFFFLLSQYLKFILEGLMGQNPHDEKIKNRFNYSFF